jgi:amidase
MSENLDVREITISAVQDAYRAGTATVAEVVQAYLGRIESIDRSGAELNAIVALSPRAKADAATLDAYFAETGQLFGPLHGVPVLIKDQVEVGGMPTSYGSEIAAEFVPERDSTVVARLRAAGAVIMGTTTMPDFATSWFSTSSRSGTTKNPYDLDRDPGGSLTCLWWESVETPEGRSVCLHHSATWWDCGSRPASSAVPECRPS